MVVSGTLYTPPKYHKAYRCLLAAKYSNAKLTVADYIPGQTDKEPEFAKKFPPSQVPCFSSNDGTNLFDANAIASFLGNAQLKGGKLEQQVSQWANYTDSVILPSVGTWVYPHLGIGKSNNVAKAKENITKIMQYMNTYLSKVTYLVGDHITQADLTVFTVLQLLFTTVYDDASRKPYPHVVRWFETIANQPEVMEICGSTVMCASVGKPAASQPSKPVNGDQTASKKKQPEPKKEKEAAAPAETAPEKKKNLLAELPAGKFVIDEWKRMFSNNDLDTVAMPWFLENFEPDLYSVWYCEYKYPEDLNLVFQSKNLIGGMFQRMETAIKYCFAGQHVFGKNKDSQISGVWFWRGTGLLFELSEDLQTDYESYTWRKLDPKNPADLKIMRDHWKGEGHYHGRDYADGRILK